MTSGSVELAIGELADLEEVVSARNKAVVGGKVR